MKRFLGLLLAGVMFAGSASAQLRIPGPGGNAAAGGGGGGWVPTDSATLDRWYSCPKIVGLVDTDPVASWVDSSSNAQHATQSTAGARPTYRTGQVNGKCAVLFDGTDDRLGFTITTGVAITISIVLKCTDATNGCVSLNLSGSSSPYAYASSSIAHFRDITGTQADVSSGIGTGFGSITLVHDGSTMTAYTNRTAGSPVGSTQNVNTDGFGYWGQASQYSMEGYIADIIIDHGAPTLTDIWNYQCTTYGVAC